MTIKRVTTQVQPFSVEALVVSKKNIQKAIHRRLENVRNSDDPKYQAAQMAKINALRIIRDELRDLIKII